MSESSKTAQRVEDIRQQTIAVLDQLFEKAEEFELAEPPEALKQYREKLAENTYKVLVVGEAKRGKSTFVNALMGRDVLPTDVDVATSQVFNIRPSEQEAYRLRFEDGSEQEITLEDLPLYGSQVMADAGYASDADRVIRWIEVDAPVRFLPKGVSILDTPGLGALYAGHAQITHRFVPEADAVIYVLESGQPVIDEDLKLIEEILSVTRNVFFIQTKIDQYGKDRWQDIQARNQEILEEKFGDRLADTRVWPVSSTNLRKAASGGEKTEEAYLMVSRHKELAVALREFLARVAGWSRTAEALLVAAEYQEVPRKTLSGRLAGFAEESKQKRADMQKVAMERKQRFDAEWGAQGQNYRELKEELKRAVAVGKQHFTQALQMGSEIERSQRTRIDGIQTLDEANLVAKEMPDEVLSVALAKWTEVCQQVQARCNELMRPFAEAANRVSAPLDPGVYGFGSSGGLEDEFKMDYFAVAKGAASGTMLLGGAGMALGMIGVALPPLGIIAIPALGWLVGKGVGDVREKQIESARRELHKRLMDTLTQVKKHFFARIAKPT